MKVMIKIYNGFLAFLLSTLMGAVGIFFLGFMQYSGIFAAFVAFITVTLMIAIFNVFCKIKFLNYLWAFLFVLASSTLICYLVVTIKNGYDVSYAFTTEGFKLIFENFKISMITDVCMCFSFNFIGVMSYFLTDKLIKYIVSKKQPVIEDSQAKNINPSKAKKQKKQIENIEEIVEQKEEAIEAKEKIAEVKEAIENIEEIAEVKEDTIEQIIEDNVTEEINNYFIKVDKLNFAGKLLIQDFGKQVKIKKNALVFDSNKEELLNIIIYLTDKKVEVNSSGLTKDL